MMYLRKRPGLIVAGMLVLSALFALAMLWVGGFMTNIGFLVLGTAIAVAAAIVAEWLRRPIKAKDLAQALYVELADRVARCAFDFESPWSAYVDPAVAISRPMSAFRVRKFVPVPPAVYQNAAKDIALLDGDAPQALVHFYFRLGAWQRDLENIAAECQAKGQNLSPEACQFLANRLCETLRPGLHALQSLAAMVDKPEQLEAKAIAFYDREHASAKRLKERIETLTPES